MHPTTHKQHQSTSISVPDPLPTHVPWNWELGGQKAWLSRWEGEYWEYFTGLETSTALQSPSFTSLLHSHICPKSNSTDVLNLQPHRA